MILMKYKDIWEYFITYILNNILLQYEAKQAHVYITGTKTANFKKVIELF